MTFISIDFPWVNPFIDIADDAEYIEAIEFVCENGLFKGVSETEFITLIRRYISGDFDLSGYDAAEADVNLDGKINGKDLTLIRRFISGGFDITLR